MTPDPAHPADPVESATQNATMHNGRTNVFFYLKDKKNSLYVRFVNCLWLGVKWKLFILLSHRKIV